VCDLHHGLANALMLEPVMRFNLEAAEGKFAELAHAVGAAGPQDFIRWLADLKRTIGIAPSLSAVGVRREQIAPMIDIAEKDTCHQTNPRPVTRADFARFFEQAM
jgi:alcohol dehydrogenase class IV